MWFCIHVFKCEWVYWKYSNCPVRNHHVTLRIALITAPKFVFMVCCIDYISFHRSNKQTRYGQEFNLSLKLFFFSKSKRRCIAQVDMVTDFCFKCNAWVWGQTRQVICPYLDNAQVIPNWWSWWTNEYCEVVSLSMPNGQESYARQDKHRTKFIENTKVTEIWITCI